MNIINMNVINRLLKFLFAHKILGLVILIVLIGGGYFAWTKLFAKTQVSYQTATAEKGTITQTVAASGQTVVSGRIAILTQASGTVKTVYVKNGQQVLKGDKLVTLELDQDGTNRQTQAWSSYLSAQNNLASAQANLYSFRSSMFTKWKTYMDLAQSGLYQNSDSTPKEDQRTLPEFHIAQDDWLATQAQYINQQGVINQAQAALTNAWANYQTVQSDVTAPISGSVQDLMIVPGMLITSQAAATGNNLVSQKIASIETGGLPIVQVALAEIDAPNVKVGQKATVTFDALPGKTFAGTIFGIDTTGTVSSGVTTYPATIQLVSGQDQILPNMSASATIITQVKQDALIIPSSAVQTSNGQSYVMVLSQGKVENIPVETGISADTNTEILSGITPGTVVVTSVVGGQTGTNGSTSPFSSSSRFGVGGGAAVLRPGGFGGGGGH